MGLVDYISCQPNQEAKVTNKYDEEFAVATITRIRDAIAANYVNTTQKNCQSQHFSSVKHTNFTCASYPHSTNYSNLLSAINCNTTQLLLENAANATQIHLNSSPRTNSTPIQHNSKSISNVSHLHSISQRKMSSPRSVPQTPPTHSRVTFQSTPNSAVNVTHSSTGGPNSQNLELSKKRCLKII